MNSLILIPLVSLVRAIAGWGENSLKDGIISLPEWKKLGETVIRMGVPMVALIWGLQMPAEVAAGLVVVADIGIVKIYNAIKSKKK